MIEIVRNSEQKVVNKLIKIKAARCRKKSHKLEEFLTLKMLGNFYMI